MAHRNNNYTIYDQNHNLLVIDKNGYNENRNLKITICEYPDYLYCKLRDPNDFIFNYSRKIDENYFSVIRNEQCLDIEFNEFRTNLIEMLQQTQRKEMFIKMEITNTNNISQLIFFGKSKIKSIVYLTIDFELANQKEIFDEMNNSLNELQRINRNLTVQLQTTKNLLEERNYELKQMTINTKLLEKQFIDNLKNINNLFTKRLDDCQNILLNKIFNLTKKLFLLIKNIEIIKTETIVKTDNNMKLIQSMENLRIESLESTNLIQELKCENARLKSEQFNSQKMIDELNRCIADKERQYNDLKAERDEIESDAQQAAIIIAQKTNANEELAKDLVQANQMLVNFNHLYESKNKEIEDLQNNCAMKERIIEEQRNKQQELMQAYEEYKAQYSAEERRHLTEELLCAKKKIEELEKSNREAAKLNELLTRKLASSDYLHRQQQYRQ